MKKIIIILIIIIGIIFSIFWFSNLQKQTPITTSANNKEATIEMSKFVFDSNISLGGFEYINKFSYLPINTYEDYKTYKSQYTFLPNILEEVFNDSFILIILSEKVNLANLSLTTPEISDTTLRINFKNDEINNSTSNEIIGLCLTVPNTMKRDVIEITNNLQEIDMNKYTPLTELADDYSIENAIKDNCLVINQKTLTTSNKHVLQEFMSSVNSKTANEIRIYNYGIINGYYCPIITDIKYTPENNFEVYTDYTKSLIKNSTYEYKKINCDNISVISDSSTLSLYSIYDDNDKFEFVIY